MKYLEKSYHLTGLLVGVFLGGWIMITLSADSIENGAYRIVLIFCVIYIATSIVEHIWSLIEEH
jgi:formate hydrogenlyase subunit 4